MRTNELAKILQLSVAQRLLIVEQIWNSIVENPDLVPLSDNQKLELDTRLNSYYQTPEAGQSWEAVKEKLQSIK